MNAADAVVETRLPTYPVRRGKVRDVYDLGEEVLLVATDRISAYDVILPTPIPGKGVMLTRISAFWFDFFAADVDHHLIEVIEDRAPTGLEDHLGELRGRTMRCVKTEVVPIECVVRGYLAGSGWKDYRRNGAVCGVALPSGLRECQRLPEPIFTPATKAETGHDENISFESACEVAGKECMTLLRDRSIQLYRRAAEYALQHGIIIADTKFEWGRRDDKYLLIDEVFTPDSSRFWPADQYEPGHDQDSFDKQYVRNYLTGLVKEGKWDKTPPGPELPPDIVANTAAKYREAMTRLIPPASSSPDSRSATQASTPPSAGAGG
ncbi:MAG: phosphoribosylaminoimidazolesuccinocarboxamide synthase [Phycisphaerae bacterium]